MKKALPFAVLLALLPLAGCGSSDEASGPAPKFGSKAGPKMGGQASGAGAPPANPTPKSNNADFGG